MKQYVLPSHVVHCRPKPARYQSQANSDETFKRLSKGEKAENKLKRRQEMNKEKRREKKLKTLPKLLDPNPDRLTKKEKKRLINERMTSSLISGQQICIDLSMQHLMSNKEIGHLSQQLGRLYGANRAWLSPAHILLVGMDTGSRLYEDCMKKHAGFQHYKWTVTSKTIEDLIVDIAANRKDLEDQNCLSNGTSPSEVRVGDSGCGDGDGRGDGDVKVQPVRPSKVVYLTPDSDNTLDDVCLDTLYVIGGLVDETVQKSVTKEKAKKLGIETARLPIKENMTKGSNVEARKVTFKTILAVNQVFEILLSYKDSRNWSEALKIGVPARTGFLSK